MAQTLTGKVALVTGGSRGIGAAIARRLAREGADVAISYSASGAKAEAVVKELTALGVRAAAFKADQAKPAEVEGLVKAVMQKFGRLDILVNNAGVYVSTALGDPAEDMAALQRQMAINIGGVQTATHAAANIMGQGGRIINIGSAAALRTPWPGMADYAGTKAAVAQMSRSWARDLGPKGITVNVVQPGPIDTEMNPADSDFAVAQKAANPLGRFGTPEEVAHLVAFLAGPEAAYITGAVINIDGGFSV